MTVQGIAPAGKNPFGLPPAGPAKKTEANPADPGFASLLAGMIAPPGTFQVPVLPVGEDREALPPGLAEGLPALPNGVSPLGALPASPENGPGAPAHNFGQVVTDLVQANQAEGAPSPHGIPHAPLQIAPATVEASTEGITVEVAPGFVVEPVPVNAELLAPETAPSGLAPERPALPVARPEEGVTAHPVALAPSAPAPGVAEAPSGNAFDGQEQGAGDPQHNPDLRALERAAEVPDSREHRPADGPQTDRFSLPPVSPQPVDAGTPPPAEPELPPSLEALRHGRHEPGRLIETIARAVNSTRDGTYSVTLRLHPEHLGEVRLQLHLNGREVSTVMEVASADARQQLESRGDQLRQSLSQAGLTLSGFSVSTGQNRQSPRERQQAFEEQLRGRLTGINRTVQPVAGAPAGAIERIKAAGRRTGRLDTMA